MAEPADVRSTGSESHDESNHGSVPMEVDVRVQRAWRRWLEALATDADAAVAASMAYAQLDGSARDQWLAAVEQEADRLCVPRIALYAPLLAVESDPERRSIIMKSIGPGDEAATPRASTRALQGTCGDGLRVAAIVTPLYMDFAQVLACGFRASEGIEWVRHDPIADRRDTPRAGDELAGVTLENVPLKLLVDELAHAVVAHSRRGRSLPEALRAFADLFGGQGPTELCARTHGG
ncbi:MAG: hypothetical protein JW940_24280 [Polyangiaceae bacterium]|nr:hypothetical protein [Polyangiaceae bacterium]